MSDETKKLIEEAERFISTQPPHVKARQTIKLMESLLAALRDAEAREGKLYAQLRDAESLWAETFVENQLLEMAEIRAILEPEKPERMMLSEVVERVREIAAALRDAETREQGLREALQYITTARECTFGIEGGPYETTGDRAHLVRIAAAALAAGKEQAK